MARKKVIEERVKTLVAESLAEKNRCAWAVSQIIAGLDLFDMFTHNATPKTYLLPSTFCLFSEVSDVSILCARRHTRISCRSSGL